MEKQHQLFVQGMMSRKFVNRKEFLNLYKLCLKQNGAFHSKYKDPEVIQHFLKVINDEFKDLNACIRKSIDERSGETYYVWVITKEHDFNIQNVCYSKQEKEYFKKLLENIVTDKNGCISTSRALNLTHEINSVSIKKTEAENYLKLFKEHGWVVWESGKISLGVSALAEFEPYIKKHSEDYIYTCDLCKVMVIYGTHCSNCDNRFHSYCWKRWFESMKKQGCPKCQSDLSEA